MDETLWKFLEQLLVIAATTLLPMFLAWLAPKVIAAWADLKSNKSDLAFGLELAAKMAVQAAEQAKLGGALIDKKQYALEIAQKWLTSYGVKIDLALIDAAIEAAVMTEFNQHEDGEGE
jgi:hypothetical protein